jgi:hypothetical protein
MSRVSVSLAVLVACVACALHSESRNQPVSGDLQQKIQELVQSFRRWDAQTTPGIKTSMKEVGRGDMDGHLAVQYHLFATGVPEGTVFQSGNVVLPTEVKEGLGGISIGKDGIVMCSGRGPQFCGDAKKPDDPIEFTVIPAKGEPYRLFLVSEDRKYRIMYSVVPDPIEGTDRGCTIEAVRLMPQFQVALIRMRGFIPNETVNLTSKSHAENRTSKPVVGSDGASDNTVLLPAVDGKSSGTTEVKVAGKSCAPTLKFDWRVN